MLVLDSKMHDHDVLLLYPLCCRCSRDIWQALRRDGAFTALATLLLDSGVYTSQSELSLVSAL